MDGLEQLLSSHNDHIKNTSNHDKRTRSQRADKCATLVDFIDMLDKVITARMKDKKVTFIPDEGRKLANDPSKEIENPYITYELISRKPKDELKPRIRETIIEEKHDNTESRVGDVFGQRFEVILQFNILTPTWRQAELVLEEFEELMLTYAYYFKRNGVGDIFFKEQFTDENLDIFREKMSIRSVQYYLELEKLTTVFYDEFESIDTK